MMPQIHGSDKKFAPPHLPAKQSPRSGPTQGQLAAHAPCFFLDIFLQNFSNEYNVNRCRVGVAVTPRSSSKCAFALHASPREFSPLTPGCASRGGIFPSWGVCFGHHVTLRRQTHRDEDEGGWADSITKSLGAKYSCPSRVCSHERRFRGNIGKEGMKKEGNLNRKKICIHTHQVGILRSQIAESKDYFQSESFT